MSRTLALAIALPLLAGCTAAAEYTENEARNQLHLDHTASTFDVRFAPGSDALLPADAVRLHRLAATGAIGQADRVTVAAGGGPELASARKAAISAELLPYGVIVTERPPGPGPRDRAVLAVERTLVRLPDCPNWSKNAGTTDFTNSVASNFGCATVTNFGRMVANPSDLASGQPLGFAQGTPAVAAIGRYQADKVELPAPSAQGEQISAPAQGKLSPGAVGGGATSAADVTANQ
ncbi:MAG TPA: CpaD family pilus assembly lipoprotein [Stellaceae bacterium]|nr:CpaD family pilus assembly lipoprotein [Stellaceae bacterium]